MRVELNSVTPAIPSSGSPLSKETTDALIALIAVVAYFIIVVLAYRTEGAAGLKGRTHPLSEVEKLLQQAHTAYKQRNYEQAIEICNTALEKQPNSQTYFRLLILRGASYSYSNKDDEALKDFDAVLTHPDVDNESKISSYKWKADIFYRQKEYEKSVTECQNGLKITPLDAVEDRLFFLRVLANACSFLNDKTQALKVFDEILTHPGVDNASKIKSYRCKADIFYQQKEYQKSVTECQNGLKITPLDAVEDRLFFLLRIAPAYYYLNDMTQAFEYISQAEALCVTPNENNLGNVLWWKGELYAYKKDYAAARKELEKAKKANPDLISQIDQRLAQIPTA